MANGPFARTAHIYVFQSGASSTDPAYRLEDITVTQTPLPCTYALVPPHPQLLAGAGSGTLSVQAPNGCGWRLEGAPGWLHLADADVHGTVQGVGNGTVAYTHDANGDDADAPPRAALLTLRGADGSDAAVVDLNQPGPNEYLAAFQLPDTIHYLDDCLSCSPAALTGGGTAVHAEERFTIVDRDGDRSLDNGDVVNLRAYRRQLNGRYVRWDFNSPYRLYGDWPNPDAAGAQFVIEVVAATTEADGAGSMASSGDASDTVLPAAIGPNARVRLRAEGTTPHPNYYIVASPTDAHMATGGTTFTIVQPLDFGMNSGAIYLDSQAHHSLAGDPAHPNIRPPRSWNVLDELHNGIGLRYLRIEANWNNQDNVNAVQHRLTEEARKGLRMDVIVVYQPREQVASDGDPALQTKIARYIDGYDVCNQGCTHTMGLYDILDAYTSGGSLPFAIETGNELNAGGQWSGGASMWLARRVRSWLNGSNPPGVTHTRKPQWQAIKVISAGPLNTYVSSAEPWWVAFRDHAGAFCVPDDLRQTCNGAAHLTAMPFDYFGVHPYSSVYMCDKGHACGDTCVNPPATYFSSCLNNWKTGVRTDLSTIRTTLASRVGVSAAAVKLMATEFGWQLPPTGTTCPFNYGGADSNCVVNQEQQHAGTVAAADALQGLVEGAVWFQYRDSDHKWGIRGPWSTSCTHPLEGGCYPVRTVGAYPALMDLTGLADFEKSVDEYWHRDMPDVTASADVSSAPDASGASADDSAAEDSSPDAALDPPCASAWNNDPPDYFRFLDEPTGETWALCVNALASRFAVEGMANGNFEPGAAVDRKTYTSWMIRTLIGYGTNGWDASWLVDPPTPHFTDVPRTYADGQSTIQADAVPYYQYIETAREYGLVGGYDDGTFRPSATLTRAQAMKILVEGMDWPHPVPSQARFHDVPVTYWAAGYIEAACAHGVISGYANGNFYPGNPLTRGQITKILYNAVNGQVQDSCPAPLPTDPCLDTANWHVTPLYPPGQSGYDMYFTNEEGWVEGDFSISPPAGCTQPYTVIAVMHPHCPGTGCNTNWECTTNSPGHCRFHWYDGGQPVVPDGTSRYVGDKLIHFTHPTSAGYDYTMHVWIKMPSDWVLRGQFTMEVLCTSGPPACEGG